MSTLVTLLVLLIATLLYMTLWFGLARWSNRTDVIDSAWGLGFIYVAWLAYAISQNRSDSKVLAGSLVTVWGLRLFIHITSRSARRPEDYRYVEYRRKWGSAYWSKTYARIFLVQGGLLWAISLTSVAIMLADGNPWRWLAIVGFIVWVFGIIFEAVSDWQLRDFMKTRKKGAIMTRGLWQYSRHPNYFGEIATWCGAALVAISYRQYWGIIGALVIIILITKISGVPPLEKHYKDNKAFQKYAKRTSVLIPKPPRQ